MKNMYDIFANWPDVKEKIKEANVDITEEDLHYHSGNELEIMNRIAAKLGKDVDWVRGWIESVAFTERIAS